MIRIVIVRHGQTAWNVSGDQGPRFRGAVDLPLSSQGIDQARITAERLAAFSLDATYSSPLQRAASTAQLIAAAHGQEPQLVPGLTSMDYGDWAGLTHTDLKQQWPELYRQWQENPFRVRAPGGESLVDLRSRAITALRSILANHRDGTVIALVTHQAVTRTLVSTLLGMPDSAWLRFRQGLCNLTCFDYDIEQDRFSLVALNDTCHLDPGLPCDSAGGTRLILVRHGQTSWNAGAGPERFRGRMDLSLDETGQSQARSIAARLRDEPVTAAYCSPLLRTQQTVAPLAEAMKLKVQPHAGLLDIDYGRFQGLTHAEAATNYPQEYVAWQKAPSQVSFPGGESLAIVQTRLMLLLDELRFRHPGQTVVLAGHQIVNKVLACTLLGLDMNQIWRIGQDTACINLYQDREGSWHTLCLNDTCHLAGGGTHPATGLSHR
jgi:broad specificity phosphatase PhoE